VEKPEYIIHLAAETHVDNSFGNSLAFTRTNVLGTHTLLECVKEYIVKGGELKLFLHMSTDEVYGSVDDDEPARKETALFAPSNPYAATKAGAEMLCHAYQKSFGIPIIITRCNNAISKYQHEEKLIPRTIRNLLEGKRMTIHGEGKAKRTFIHAYDIASALDVVMTRGEVGSVYNIGTRMEYSVIEVVQHILELLKPGERMEDWIEFIPDRAFQDYRYYIDMSELMRLGWKEEISFEQAVKEVIARYMAPENAR
jgi:dTDP-glucose 4,6-dehydratase